MCPGKAKPAPCFSSAFAIGLVQTASASPACASATARAMIATTAGALRASGRPGVAGCGSGWSSTGSPSAIAAAAAAGASIGRTGSPSRAPSAATCPRSPIRKNAGPSPQRRPGPERDLGPDPGRVAEGQRDRRGHRSMMIASPSSSWM